ncbi:Transcriptional regulatory protein BaeR [Halioglobus japonicus]|nr:Transcriptional regulatory protein BaeR [Halioglobus japonicus]
MNNLDIVVVEDEPKIAQLLVDYLERDGFFVTVLNDGEHAVEIIRERGPGFVILDLMLPGKDGLAICREVRQFSSVPIMMLTAKVDEIDRLVGLELGADDYVCKPFSPREVVARVRTIQRRLQHQAPLTPQSELSYRDITINLERYECSVRGQRIELTPVELQLLRGFVSQPGRVFSRDQLMDMAYKDERVVSDRTIDTHIKNIRRKLSQAGDEVGQVHSIYGVGYKLE